jgi:acyl-CoA thioester hydrolase
MSDSRVLVHTSVQPIRWGDMDALGHVNNTVYFRYMEQARIAWFYQLTGGSVAGYDASTGPVIINTSCTFATPLVYPGAVDVRMYLGKPGRTSIESYYELERDGHVCADGAAKIVWIDMTTRRPVPLPEAITACFAPPAVLPGGSLPG